MSTPTRIPPEALNAWLAKASEKLELGLEADEVPIALILDVAADVAHSVARPAAPLSTFLLGLALGQRSQGETSLTELSAQLSELASDWVQPEALQATAS